MKKETNYKITKDSIEMNRWQKHKTKRSSLIVAKVIISESELAIGIPEYNSNYEQEHPGKFKQVLYRLGIDVSLPYARQDGLWHRNRLNQVVLCSRWIGEERQDRNWVRSGYASREAVDKYSGSKILEDLYRMKSMTQDAQEHLEDRDRYSVIDETQWQD